MQNQVVETNRILYTPSKFGKDNLIYLQEVGKSKTLQKHTSSRNKLDSYLFFMVLEGNGQLYYQNQNYQLKKNDCVFLDCHNKYAHSSDNWTIAWAHFNAANLSAIYQKYLDRNGKFIFNSSNFDKYQNILKEIYLCANSNDYIKDMNIYNHLTTLLSLIMSETIYLENNKRKHKYNVEDIKNYLDENYLKQISLDNLSEIFYIDKFYLTRIFKESYGLTINNYILKKRITKAKELIRFANKNFENIALECGFNDANYFSRIFKKIEGCTPLEYKKKW